MSEPAESVSPPDQRTDEVIWLDPQKPWFFIERDLEKGPLSLADLRTAMASGDVRGETLLWQEGLKSWTRADMLQQLGLLWEAVGARPVPEGRRATVDTSLASFALPSARREATETRLARPRRPTFHPRAPESVPLPPRPGSRDTVIGPTAAVAREARETSALGSGPAPMEPSSAAPSTSFTARAAPLGASTAWPSTELAVRGAHWSAALPAFGWMALGAAIASTVHFLLLLAFGRI